MVELTADDLDEALFWDDGSSFGASSGATGSFTSAAGERFVTLGGSNIPPANVAGIAGSSALDSLIGDEPASSTAPLYPIVGHCQPPWFLPFPACAS